MPGPYRCPKCKQFSNNYWPLTIAASCSDIARCNCRAGYEFVTDDADFVRTEIDKDRGTLALLPVAHRRSLLLASAIYGHATHGAVIRYADIEQALGVGARQQANVSKTEIKEQKRFFARPNRDPTALPAPDLHDPRVGVMIVPMRIGATADNNLQLYIVFRGSRSDVGVKNPMDAGWATKDSGSRVNIDWNANLFNRQKDVPWASLPGTRVHEGFLSVYSSVRPYITKKVQKWITRVNTAGGRLSVIVTGHSLGAALAVLCAHDLNASVQGAKPFCFPFNTPRVGNARFAEDFYMNLANQRDFIAGESGAFNRCVNTMRQADKVSTGQTHAFKDQFTKSERRFLSSRTGDGKLADAAVIVKAMPGMVKGEDKKSIYYQTPMALWIAGGSMITAHNFTLMQQTVVGQVVFEDDG